MTNKNPYTENRTYVKYRDTKEIYRTVKHYRNHIVLNNNGILLREFDNKKIIINALNEQISSTLPGLIIHADSIHHFYYLKLDNATLKKYRFDGTEDPSFKWEGGEIKEELNTLADGRLYYSRFRYSSDSSLDNTFRGIENKSTSIYGGEIFRMLKYGYYMVLLDAESHYSSSGQLSF